MKVYLSPLAERKLLSILEYLEQKWGRRSKAEFLEKIKRCIDQISHQPYSCSESTQMPGLFKCVVTKQTSFYYRLSTQSIEIIAVIDSRQDPGKTIGELRSLFD